METHDVTVMKRIGYVLFGKCPDNPHLWEI